MIIKELDTIVLSKAIPSEGLEVGAKGTVLYVYHTGAYEVEFIGSKGFTVVTLEANDIES